MQTIPRTIFPKDPGPRHRLRYLESVVFFSGHMIFWHTAIISRTLIYRD